MDLSSLPRPIETRTAKPGTRKRFGSIRSRILGGFVALLLLQVVVAVAIWQAQRRVETARLADATSEMASRDVTRVSAGLAATQLRLDDYLRSGGVVERDAVGKALDALTSQGATAAVDQGGHSLATTTAEVKEGLKTVLTSAAARRNASTTVMADVVGVQNALVALGQAITRVPDRATLEATVPGFAGAVEPLAAASRFAVAANPKDAQAALAALVTLKSALQAVSQTGAEIPARIGRLTGTVVRNLDVLVSDISGLSAAEAANNANLAALETVVHRANASMAAALQGIDAERGVSQVQAHDARAIMQVTIVAATAVGCGLGLLLAILVGLSITRPIERLAATMRRIAGGQLDADVPDQQRRDEIGAMAAAVQVFKESGIQKLGLERQAKADRQTSEEERARSEAERQVLAEEQAVVVRGLADALARLSAGDLTCEMSVVFAPVYEKLRADFNGAVEELRVVIGTIIDNTGTIRSGTMEISKAADDLSRRTERQAATLEQTAAALDEITAGVRKTAEGALLAHGVVVSAKTEAEQGEVVVGDAVAAMSAIERSSEEIRQIIGVIDEIAFQTNLLALNAGVEAARAGDAGRGFAVVASEVRALAQRSAQAAKEIKLLIGSSSTHVSSGVALVRKSGAALGRIAGQVLQIDHVVNAIVASAREQASGLAEVNKAVNQMDQVTQQNAAMVEQSTAASRKLVEETAELERLTARFTTGVVTREHDAGSGSGSARIEAAEEGEASDYRALSRSAR